MKGDPERKQGVKPRDGTVYETETGRTKERMQLANNFQDHQRVFLPPVSEPKTIWKDRAILQGPRPCHA